LIPVANDQGMTVLAWSPLRGGMLTGKYLPEFQSDGNRGSRLNTESMKGFADTDASGMRTIREVVELAKEIDATPSQVALAWLRQRIVPVIPIIGARTMNQLRDNLKCIDVTLSPQHIRRLDDCSEVSMGFPHEFLDSDRAKAVTFGGMRDRIKV
jgi:aryl-alcohol dehydrogenase-like predicted oxidoreductase